MIEDKRPKRKRFPFVWTESSCELLLLHENCRITRKETVFFTHASLRTNVEGPHRVHSASEYLGIPEIIAFSILISPEQVAVLFL